MNQAFFSEPILNRCVPKLSGGGSSSLLSGTGIQSFANDLAQDFQVCQSELAQMGITALGLSVLMTIAFRFLAGLIVYAIIALVVVALVTGTIALWVIWWLKKTDMAERSEVLDSLDTTQLSAAQNVTQSLVGGVSTAKSQEEVTFFLVAAIMATIITVSNIKNKNEEYTATIFITGCDSDCSVRFEEKNRIGRGSVP